MQRLNYDERSLLATANQLIGNEWSLGVQYRYTRSELKTSYPELVPLLPPPNSPLNAELHEITPYIVFNSRYSCFARAEAPWYAQKSWGNYLAPLPGDHFYQVNLFAGYRFPRQHGDFTFGLLNVNNTNYHLNPLNLYAELPRSRVWSVRLRLNF